MMNDFQEMVYDVVRLIPEGRVTSYGAIAKYLGSARSSRMVGWTMNKSHQQDVYVPAHRVVNRNGLLTGKHFFSSEHTMADLLIREGVTVVDDKVKNFDTVFWDPQKELGDDIEK